jgi:WD40 repeat protein
MKSFYGHIRELSSVELLKLTKCTSYFCADIVQSDLYGLKISPEYFDLLLEIISLPEITIDKMLLRTVRRNLPKDYNTSRLSEEFIEMILAKDVKIVSTSADKTIKLWDMESGECTQTYTGHQKEVLSIALSSNNSQMISDSCDDTLKLWDVESGECIRTYNQPYQVVSVALASDNRQMVSVNSNCILNY